ncbi:hypothetical protein JCM3765_005824 [Sporobolomyces pararoseus]
MSRLQTCSESRRTLDLESSRRSSSLEQLFEPGAPSSATSTWLHRSLILHHRVRGGLQRISRTIAADCPTNFRDLSSFPFDNFLSITQYPVSLQKQVKNSVVNFRPLYSRTDVWPLVEDWFKNIQKLTIPSTNNNNIRFFFCGYPYRLGLKSYEEGLRGVQAKGFLVIDEIDAEEEARRVEEEGLDFERPEVDDLTSLIFPSFVNYLQQAGKLRDK